ncbi:hypothetical protein [Sphingomonas sp.]|uniref:hypothetical protein n=1 Tax=Sphingomonas sp. TaxID=28214 RepID=UPI00286C3EEE|nr:hypothetical protein [Sphingomonas sp.]
MKSGAINSGPLLGYRAKDWTIIEDGPVTREWAKTKLDEAVARNRAGTCEIDDSFVGLYRQGDLNAFELYVVGAKRSEVTWDYRYGPPHLLIFERVSYNRRIIEDFANLYLMLDFYCANQFEALADAMDRQKKASDFRSSFKS